jgi:hypothetical protein
MHHASEKEKGISAAESHGSDCLPAAVAKRGAVAAAPATTSTAASTTTATAPATTTATATAAATTVANHLGETGVDLLLGLAKDVNQVTGLLGILNLVSKVLGIVMEEGGNSLSVVNRVMAVPSRPARAVRPIR